MTTISMCGIVRDDGRDCTGYVSPDSVLNLCAAHLQQAYDLAAREQGSVLQPMPSTCQMCGNIDGIEYAHGWMCGMCGWPLGAEPPARSAGTRTRSRISVVYYIGFSDRVKIGWSTNLLSRLSVLPHDEVLALELGGQPDEYRRHQQFAATRIRSSEWFDHSPELDAHIRKLRAGVDDPIAQYRFWVRRDAA